MKRLWIAAGLLVLLLAAALVNAWNIDRLTGGLLDTLEQAEALADAADWTQAADLTRQARDRWQRSAGYLCAVLPHEDTDQIASGFETVLELLARQDSGEYASASAALMARLGLLAEMEQPTLKNIL